MAQIEGNPKCSRCGTETSPLEMFPGGICLKCYAAKEGQEPLTQADFNGMVRTFKTGGRAIRNTRKRS